MSDEIAKYYFKYLYVGEYSPQIYKFFKNNFVENSLFECTYKIEM
jgi:hypothetical protein